MPRASINRTNWFLVIPTIILGLGVLYTVNRMYAAGDIRRSIETVLDYTVEGRPALAEFIAGEGQLECTAEIISRFYGKVDVACRGPESGNLYRWVVHVGQLAFAPADERTRVLMETYAPQLFVREEQGR